MIALVATLLVLIALTQFIISLGILLESRYSSQIAQRLFVVLATLTFFWTVANTILIFVDTKASTTNIGLFNIVNKSAFTFGAISLLTIYIFNLFYPIHKPIHRLQKVVAMVGLSLAAVSPFDIISGRFTYNGNELLYREGGLSILFAIFSLSVLIAVYVDNARTLRASKEYLLKKQSTTVLVGLTLTIVHAVIFLIVLPNFYTNSEFLYAVGYCAPYYYMGFTIYSLFKQNLFDVRLIVARTIGYIFTIATLVGLYVVAVFNLSTTLLGVAQTSLVQRTLYIAATLIFGFSLSPLKKFFDRITNKLFYRDAYDAQVFLDTFNKTIVGSIDLQPLLAESGSLIATTLKAEYCVFGIHETSSSQSRLVSTNHSPINEATITEVSKLPQVHQKVTIVTSLSEKYTKLKEVLTSKDVAVLAKLTNKTGPTQGQGYLFLGQKKSGNPYNKQDMLVLEIVVNELVIAIQNALRFEEIQTFNVTLQAKVDDATRQLRQTNEKLKALDETKDEFISMASHQLRTPLTAVKGYVSMVVEGDAGKLNKQQQELLNQAFVSSQRMVYLIADLLNVSRLKSGKFVIENKPTKLIEVVESEMEQLTEVAKGKNQTLTFNKPENFPELMLDETKIRQVIMNFADNALHYTQPGGHIQLNLEDKGDSVEFTVVDDGLGVPKSEQHHLFTKFFRAANAKKARPDGTGLGLFMAKKVIIAQGGAVIFSSEEGKGSTFGFTFPKAKLQVTKK